jgi:hypothetical protein
MSDLERPYILHTNRELPMMLAGTKPLAVFTHERVDGFEKSDALASQDFAPHVTDGTLSEHLRTFQIPLRSGATLDIDYWFYTLRGEEWRVEAYLLLLELMHRGPWCPQLEWLEGTLLGYTDEENLYHLSQAYPEDQFVAGISASLRQKSSV